MSLLAATVRVCRRRAVHGERGEDGPGLSLKFEVLEGEHAGAEASRIVSQKMSPKSALGRCCGDKGGAIGQGESFSFAPFVGVTGSIIVESTDAGGSRDRHSFATRRHNLRRWLSRRLRQLLHSDPNANASGHNPRRGLFSFADEYEERIRNVYCSRRNRNRQSLCPAWLASGDPTRVS